MTIFRIKRTAAGGASTFLDTSEAGRVYDAAEVAQREVDALNAAATDGSTYAPVVYYSEPGDPPPGG